MVLRNFAFYLLGFSWTDGKPLVFINWYTDEPHTMNRHLCVGMGSNGKWWDTACYGKFKSFCKLPLGNLLFFSHQ